MRKEGGGNMYYKYYPHGPPPNFFGLMPPCGEMDQAKLTLLVGDHEISVISKFLRPRRIRPHVIAGPRPRKWWKVEGRIWLTTPRKADKLRLSTAPNQICDSSATDSQGTLELAGIFRVSCSNARGIPRRVIVINRGKKV